MEESPHAGPRSIAVTGASGLVGTALTAFLSTAGCEVCPVVRRTPSHAREIRWDPARGEIDPGDWEGIDAIVNLAGEGIAAARWSDAQKKRIRDSRVLGARLLAKTVASMDSPPRVLVSASATGFYGDRGDEILDEDSPPGTGFLADVCRAWEDAYLPAVDAGLRVVLLRIGVVLSARGGALKRMLPPFRFGLGGRLGSGRQYMSWIGLEDLVGVVVRALTDETLSGPVNAVAPDPVTNTEFTRTLARVLRRPAVLPVPAFALRAIAGEMADALLLSSTRVRPARLLDRGFPYRHPGLGQALENETG